MSLLGRVFGMPPAEPDLAQGALDKLRADTTITPAQIEAEEYRQLATYRLECAESAEALAARYEAAGEHVKAALERKHAAEDRAASERYKAKARKLTGEVA